METNTNTDTDTDITTDRETGTTTATGTDTAANTQQQPQKTHCRLCGIAIPEERLEALPETMVCTPCSLKMGGEFELKVTTNSTGKAGSLKRTGTDVTITLQRKKLI